MLKKLTKKLMSVVLAFSTISVLAACDKEKKETLSNAELSVVYKEVALSAWDKIGISDPTVSVNALSSSIPDKKTETNDAGSIANIISNGNSMAGMIYMISLLYSNEAFVTTDDIAIFDATVTIMGQTVTQNYVLETYIDMDNDKVYLQAVVTTMGTAQYSGVEVDYDFDEETLKSYRFYSTILTSAVDMSLTEDNKYMWYETEDLTDDFAVAVLTKKQEFLARAAEVTKLDETFDDEMQAYMTVLEKTINDLRN